MNSNIRQIQNMQEQSLKVHRLKPRSVEKLAMHPIRLSCEMAIGGRKGEKKDLY